MKKTKKDKESYGDCFYSRLVFIQALEALLPPGKGVFVELHGKATDIGVSRVIVHNREETNEMVVTIAEERTDLKHGDRIEMINGDLIKN